LGVDVFSACDLTISYCLVVLIVTVHARVVVGMFLALTVLLVAGPLDQGMEIGISGRGEGDIITNLAQLRAAAIRKPHVVRPIRIVADVYDVDASCGILVLGDGSSIEFVQAESGLSNGITRGSKICMEAVGCGVRRKNFGLAIIPGLVVENDGVHPMTVESGVVYLRAGLNPVVVRWFNRTADYALTVEYEGPGIPRQQIPSSVLSSVYNDANIKKTNLVSGVQYRCYEGFWVQLPDLTRMNPVKSGGVPNFDLGVRTRDEGVAIEFVGYISIPHDGFYTFHLGSDDGSQLFVGYPQIEIRPLPERKIGDYFGGRIFGKNGDEDEFRWVSVEGTVVFPALLSEGGEMILRVGGNDFRVMIFEDCGRRPPVMAHSRVRVSGVYEDVMLGNEVGLPGILKIATWNDVELVGVDMQKIPQVTNVVSPWNETNVLTTAAEVKELTIEEAKKQLPVRIRGVVTATLPPYVHGAVIQDTTRGIFVSYLGLNLEEPLRWGEVYEVEGVTGPGDFAPIIIARQIKHLGTGKLPEPIRPAWKQLFSGALDTQYVELEGVVLGVDNQEVDLLTADGEVVVIMDDFQPERLTEYENALVRIRGCAFAIFNMQTRELNTAAVRILGGAIEVVQPPRTDLFTAPLKRLGDLLLYDPNAAPLRFLKIEGQVVYKVRNEYFLTDGTNTVCVNLRDRHNADFSIRDVVEVVGFLDCSGPLPLLKKAIMRKAGRGTLPLPIQVEHRDLLSRSHCGRLVKFEGRLLNMWWNGFEYVLELQSDFVGYRARLVASPKQVQRLRIGSLLELTGVYVPQELSPSGNVTGFELLLYSPNCVRVLANPPWWTLKRALYAIGLLVVLLIGVLIWNKQLHREVQERTRRLENEIRKRELAELQHAAEMERTRIARDLHDELGAGLTAISLMASVGVTGHEGRDTVHQRLVKIAEKARTLVESLDVIVWAVDPKRDSLQSFMDYTASYAKEILDAAGIFCRLRLPFDCDGIMLSGPVRHSLFLAVKEALNNIIRHARATEVELVMTVQFNQLELVIKDNGHGFDLNSARLGDGLRNMQSRLAALGGSCAIISKPGEGTTVRFLLPLGNTSHGLS